MEAGFSRLDSAALYVAQTCFLAAESGCPPSAIHQGTPLGQAKWSRKDRMLMLAYYQVRDKYIEVEANRHHGFPQFTPQQP